MSNTSSSPGAKNSHPGMHTLAERGPLTRRVVHDQGGFRVPPQDMELKKCNGDQRVALRGGGGRRWQGC